MSTKIYEAYMVHNMAVFDSFMKYYRKAVTKKTAKFLNVCKKTINVEEIKKAYIKENILTEKTCEVLGDEFVRCFHLFFEMIEQSDRCMNDIFNLDCSFNFWCDVDGSIYFIPYNSRVCRITKGMERKFRLQDFCYFDNTDRPKGISNKTWEIRKNKWDQLCLEECDDWSKNRYSHVIIEAKYPDIGLREIEKIIYKKKHDPFNSPLYQAVSRHMSYKYNLRNENADQKN